MAFWSRKKKTRSSFAIPIAVGNVETVGYTKLSDNPDVLIAVDKIADLVSNMTIHLMENTDQGDKRLKNQLSRKIDIEPYRNMTRKSWIYKIVRDLLLDGDGNSIVHIGIDSQTTFIEDLTPLPMQAVSYEDINGGYLINYNGLTYSPDEVIHFVLNPNPLYPYKGTGYRVALREIVKNLNQMTKTKNNFMSGKYMPSLIISVDALTEELASPEGRQEVMKKYFDETEGGKPWIIPADLIKVEQVKPLSLKDIAIIEGAELDKKTVAGLIGVPAFFLGVGEFNKEEYNNFINTRVYAIGQVISQTLTRDLLFNPNWFFRLNPRSLYSYDLTEMVSSGTQLIDRNTMRRNELRDWIGLDPDEEMEELIILENYIPSNMLGQQNKLSGLSSSQVSESDNKNKEEITDPPNIAENLDENETVSKVSLNGAQIQSLLSIVQAVAAKQLEYESAITLITSAFPFDEGTAKEILGNPNNLVTEGGDVNE